MLLKSEAVCETVFASVFLKQFDTNSPDQDKQHSWFSMFLKSQFPRVTASHECL